MKLIELLRNSNKTILFHFTSPHSLLKILEDNAIVPSSQTGYVSLTRDINHKFVGKHVTVRIDLDRELLSNRFKIVLHRGDADQMQTHEREAEERVNNNIAPLNRFVTQIVIDQRLKTNQELCNQLETLAQNFGITLVYQKDINKIVKHVSEAWQNFVGDKSNIKTLNHNIKISFGVVDSRKNEMSGYVAAYDSSSERKYKDPIHGEEDYKCVGLLNWSEYENHVHIKMIQTLPEYQRQRIGLALLSRLQKEFPKAELDFGYVTGEGKHLLEDNFKGQTNVKGTVYLIHLDRPLHHSQHYLGWTTNLDKRIQEHKIGKGSAFLRAAKQQGINFEIVRTWPNEDRNFERKLKNYKKAKTFCPVCQQNKNNKDAEIIVEVRDANLYHITNLATAYKIIKSNELKPKTEHLLPLTNKTVMGSSLTRDKHLGGSNETFGDIMFEFDRTKLSHNHKIIPIDYFYDAENNETTKTRRKGEYAEAEEFIPGGIKNLDKYITAIYIPKKKMDWMIKNKDRIKENNGVDLDLILNNPKTKIVGNI